MVSDQNRTRTRVDTWHDMGHTSNLGLSWDKRGMRAKKSPFPGFDREREGRRGKEESQASSHDLWSSTGRFSSGQEQIFIASTRGTHGYLKKGIFPKIQEGRFWEIEVVGFRRLPRGKGFFLPWLTFHLRPGK